MAKGNGLSFVGGKVDSSLDQLFSTTLNTTVPKSRASEPPRKKIKVVDVSEPESSSAEDDSEITSDGSSSVPDQASDVEGEDAEDTTISDEDEDEVEEDEPVKEDSTKRSKRKRANDDDMELEDRYMAKLSREDELRKEQQKKQRKAENPDDTSSDAESGSDDVDEEDDEEEFEIPRHETQDESMGKGELDKAARTVFLGNVSTEAIRSKSTMRELTAHLTSFELESGKQEDGEGQPVRIESFRFRSVAFSTVSIPRKAAFARKDLMDATTRSTNAYAVYNSAQTAREAVKQLNGSIVLGRHLRVDGVAHPSPTDHRRCVFVGNLGFVDDESVIRAAEEESEEDDDEDDENGSGEPKKKTKKRSSKKVKQPADVEEGLWRTFATAGKVESVRVVRDRTTRVGKGIAYVQFEDQVAVEKALRLDGKAFPPFLPRALRVTRAKKPSKTNAAVERQKAQAAAAAAAAARFRSQKGKEGVYNPKFQVDTDARTMGGRATKLLGRAGAAQLRMGSRGGDRGGSEGNSGSGSGSGGIQAPESFVVEGYRASSKDGKGKMNFKPVRSKKGVNSGTSRKGKAGKAKGKGKGKPMSRSSRRGAAFKAAGGRK